MYYKPEVRPFWILQTHNRYNKVSPKRDVTVLARPAVTATWPPMHEPGASSPHAWPAGPPAALQTTDDDDRHRRVDRRISLRNQYSLVETWAQAWQETTWHVIARSLWKLFLRCCALGEYLSKEKVALLICCARLLSAGEDDFFGLCAVQFQVFVDQVQVGVVLLRQRVVSSPNSHKKNSLTTRRSGNGVEI